MTYSEEDVLLAALPEPHRTAVQLGLETGIRLQSEGLSLTWPNVHLDQARALIAAEHAKNGRERWIHLSPDMVTRLRTMQGGAPARTSSRPPVAARSTASSTCTSRRCAR